MSCFCNVKGLFSLFFIVILSVVVFAEDFSSTPELKHEIYLAIDSYYSAFSSKDMDAYLDTQYIEQLSPDELAAKKELIQAMWDSYISDYSLSDESDCVFVIDDSMAFIEYTLSVSLFDLYYTVLDSYELRMTAILFKKDFGWKIFNTVPTSVFDFDTVVDLFVEQDEMNTSDEMQADNSKTALDIPINENSLNDNSITNLSTTSETHCDLVPIALTEKYSLENVPFVDVLIGNNSFIRVIVDGKTIETYHYFDAGILSVPSSENVDYVVKLDSCTLQRLLQGANPKDEFEAENIKLEGKKLLPSVKVSLGTFFFKIYSWFSRVFSDEEYSDTFSDDDFKLKIEAETGELENAGRYSFIGPTSRGPGELYLGDKGAFATYTFTLAEDRTLFLYARVNDDGKHRNGARNAEFKVDDKTVLYKQTSHDYLADGSIWGWVYIGTFNLSSGTHILKIMKPEQTSAAFIADSFLFLDEKRKISQLDE